MPSRGETKPLSIRGLNHISRACDDVVKSQRFYRDVLGFVDVKRPNSLSHFEGAWLFHPNTCFGLHLIARPPDTTPIAKPKEINPMSDHLSFVVPCLAEVEALLERSHVEYIKQCIIEEEGVTVTQVFFHDPDNNMIEICNCDELPVVVIEDHVEASCPSCGPMRPHGASILIRRRSSLALHLPDDINE